LNDYIFHTTDYLFSSLGIDANVSRSYNVNYDFEKKQKFTRTFRDAYPLNIMKGGFGMHGH